MQPESSAIPPPHRPVPHGPVSGAAIEANQVVTPVTPAPRRETPRAATLQVIEPAADGRNDRMLITMWLHGKAPKTQAEYLRDTVRYLAFLSEMGVSLVTSSVRHLHAFEETLSHLRPATTSRRMASLKSLYSYAHQLGYLERNWGAMIRLRKAADRLSERILSESDVARLIGRETRPREYAILHLAYRAGLRAEELATLKWRSVIEVAGRYGRARAQVTVLGKGGKTRSVLLPTSTWRALEEMGRGLPDDPVFASRKRDPRTGRPGHLDRRSIWRLVKEAARRTGLPEASTHWLRHAHASHALDRGAPVHLVKDTLGHGSLTTTSRYTHARPGDSSSMYLGD